MSVSEDIGLYLTYTGWNLGMALDTNLFLDNMPESPDSLVSIYEYPGSSPKRTHEVYGIAYQRPRIQVCVRSEIDDPTSAKEVIHDIYALIGSIARVPINGTRYLKFDIQQDPFLLDRDDNRRYTYAFNAEAYKDFS